MVKAFLIIRFVRILVSGEEALNEKKKTAIQQLPPRERGGNGQGRRRTNIMAFARLKVEAEIAIKDFRTISDVVISIGL